MSHCKYLQYAYFTIEEYSLHTHFGHFFLPLGAMVKEIQVRCGYKKCRKAVDVKNVRGSLAASRAKVDLSLCRTLRSHCKSVKFCSEAHRDLCIAKRPKGKRGGREPLTADQFVKLFQTLQSFAPWAAMLSMLQLCIGDRADCSRQCRWSWIKSLNPASKKAATISIPKVNGKTVAREIPLHEPFAKFLWQVSQTNCLEASNGEQWPHHGQQLSPNKPLFPGFDCTGQTRDWSKPISERAYLQKLAAASDILGREVAAATLEGKGHVFKGFDLTKLGTHSMKKTAVTLMAEAQVSFSIISKITGTSPEMLQKTYDMPTVTRQSRAMASAYQGVFAEGLGSSQDSKPASRASSKFCGMCGMARGNLKQQFCTQCGERLN